MKRLIFFITLFTAITINLSSQVRMKGTISAIENGKNIAVDFANIVLYSAADTTKMIAGTVSDLKGNYLFDNLEIGRYRLVISCLGYKTVSKTLRVSLPSSGDVLVRDYTLQQDAQMLAEVTVKGQRRRQYIDKASYTFTKDDVKSAIHSQDLLATLPELTIDPQSKRVRTMKGSSLLILINGATASDNELKMLPPDKIVRVEYYDFPPARYAGAGAVANIITRSLNDGYGGGIDVSHALTTGFGNDNVYFNYHQGRHQIALDYQLNYRNYKKRESSSIYRYTLNNETRESEYLNQDKFGYTTHTVGLKYTNQLLDDYILQMTLRPNFETRFQDGTSKIENRFGSQKANYSGINNSHTLILSPVVDIYYWKALPNNSEISANVVGTMFRTSVESNQYEYLQPSNTQTLEDEMRLKNHKQSLIGELAYTKKLGLNNWNSGYRTEASWLNSDIQNLLGDFDYQSRYTKHYLYSELSGMKNKLLYRISLGGTYITNQSYSNKYSRFVFTPLAMIGYSINNRNTIRLLVQRETLLPSVSDLSNNAQIITSDILSKGNPDLVNATQTGGGLVYSFNNRYVNMNMGMLYEYTDKPFNQFFMQEPDSKHITVTKENALYSQNYGGFLSGEIKPFGTKLFSIKTSAQILRQQLKSELIGTISNWYCPIDVVGTFQTNKWTVSYQYRFTSMSLQGAYLVRDENQAHFSARYALNKNLAFSANVLWTFTPSRYHSETLSGSLVSNQRDTKIWDNQSMVVVGVSWNFNKGKDYKTKRTLSNQDKDAATF